MSRSWTSVSRSFEETAWSPRMRRASARIFNRVLPILIIFSRTFNHKLAKTGGFFHPSTLISAHDYNKRFFIIDYIGITAHLSNKNVGFCTCFEKINDMGNRRIVAWTDMLKWMTPIGGQ